MYIQLFLAACLLGPILASPIPEDTCDAENKRREECIEKYDRNIPEWWEDSFMEKLFPLQVWKDCVGEAKCDHVKKLNELSEVMYHEFVYLNLNLRTCLGNGTVEKISKSCEKPGQSKLPCEDPTYYDCMTSEMMEHKSCNDQDVEAFNALVPLLIQDCNLTREVHGGGKSEGTKNLYEKTGMSKFFYRATHSSFLDIIWALFTGN
ncbi:hypothetical protein CAEBREN_08178 [Caenorhabditis brenneri]|uniref:DUF19 domain-containing protein n=1 Tax=Caenorhabditis brenneri TaxID=135651 RepID=G0NNN8_CAEBE|nr:hypothetical protein CAEBREN_08178 [Caenorhabditis brenneri]